MKSLRFKDLGPGLLFAGAAVGVSHLVQSTRAGAEFGTSLLWALLLANLFKYPFFLLSAQYTSIKQESLLDGYFKLHPAILWICLLINLFTMFTIQAAVTMVTSGLVIELFHLENVPFASVLVIAFCAIILIAGRFQTLDRFIKIIIILLTISTIMAVLLALNTSHTEFNWKQHIPSDAYGVAFLLAFMGWMPAPLDVTLWNSLWIIEKNKTQSVNLKKTLLDFKIGYWGATFLAVCFLLLGYLVMYDSGETFSPKSGLFARQLIDLYTQTLGSHFYYLIIIAALTTMLSTTLTTLDASPRVMDRITSLLFGIQSKKSYWVWMLFLIIGTLMILTLFVQNMGTMVKVATILSFITAPFYAIMNFYLMIQPSVSKKYPMKLSIKILSILGILFLLGFSIWYMVLL